MTERREIKLPPFLEHRLHKRAGWWVGSRAGGAIVNDELTPRVHEALNRQWEPVYRSGLHYLVSWSTRGKKPVLRDRHLLKLRELVPAFCEERGIDLLELAAGRERMRL